MKNAYFKIHFELNYSTISQFHVTSAVETRNWTLYTKKIENTINFMLKL